MSLRESDACHIVETVSPSAISGSIAQPSPDETSSIIENASLHS